MLAINLALIGAEPLEFVVTDSKLSEGMYLSAVAYDGQDSIYILGGSTDTLPSYYNDKVLKYSVISGVVDVVGTFVNIFQGVAILSGQDMIYFGGLADRAFIPSAYRVSTIERHGGVKVKNDLPGAMIQTGVAWDGSNHLAYLFEGTEIVTDAVNSTTPVTTNSIR